MSEDPHRLVDLGGPSALLVASATDDAPSAESVQRAAARLGVAGVAVAGAVVVTKGAVAGATAAAGSSSALGATTQAVGVSLFAKVAIGVSVALVAAGGAVVATSTPAPTPPASAVARPVAAGANARPPASQRSDAPGASPSDAPATTTTAPFASTVAPSTVTSAAPTTTTGTAAPPPTSTQSGTVAASSETPARPDVRDEIAWLDRARSELASGQARAAIATLDQHAKDFARGTLGMEAEMLRIEAMIRGDQPSEGRARGAALLARDPNGPYAKRLRTLIDR